MSFNTWTPLGTILTSAGQGTLLYETGSQLGLGAGSVFKIWYGIQGGGIGYAESLTALPGSWTTYGTHLTGLGSPTAGPKLFKNAGTYYLYVSTQGFGAGATISVFTSTDGVTFSLAKADAIASAGGWEGTSVFQLAVLDQVAGTWTGYYTSNSGGYMGLATSTDLITWTKGGSNPVISVATSNFTFQKVGSTYYGYSQANSAFPTLVGDGNTAIYRFTSTSVSGPWTQWPVPTYQASVPTDYYPNAAALNNLANQLGDPCMVELNGNAYLIYSVGYGQTGFFNLNVAVAYNTTIAEIVTGYEGALNTPINQSQPNGAPYSGVNQPIQQYDVGTGTNANPIAGNWTPLATSAGYTTAQRSSNTIIGSTAGDICDSYDNSTVWGADQWASVTVERPASTTSQVGISLRQNTSGVATAYRFYWTYSTGASGVGTWFIDKLVAGVTTNLATGALTVSNNDVLMAAVVGTNLMFFYNGLQFVAVTDTSISSGAAGFALMPVTSTANAVLQNWQGGSFRNPANGTATGTFIQKNVGFNGSPAAGPFTIAYSSNVTAGNFLGLYLRATAASGSSDPTVVITDSQNNVWVRDYSVDDGSGHESINFYHCLNAKSSAANTISIAMSGGGASTYYYSAACFEYSGVGALDTVAPYAYPNGGGAFPSILTSGPATIFGCTTFGSGSIAAGAGFTLRAQINGVYDNIEDQYSSTSGPFSVAFTNEAVTSLRPFGVAYQAIAYSISGSTGQPYTLVSWTGTASGSVNADASGNYVIPDLINGSYTITPSLTGYTFSPTSASKTVSGSNITGVNFTAVPPPASAGSSFGFGFKLDF